MTSLLVTHPLFGACGAKQVGIPPPSTEEDTQSLKQGVACLIILSVGPHGGADLLTTTVHRPGLSYLLPWCQLDTALEEGRAA